MVNLTEYNNYKEGWEVIDKSVIAFGVYLSLVPQH